MQTGKGGLQLGAEWISFSFPINPVASFCATTLG